MMLHLILSMRHRLTKAGRTLRKLGLTKMGVGYTYGSF
jgi:hypothetical protein